MKLLSIVIASTLPLLGCVSINTAKPVAGDSRPATLQAATTDFERGRAAILAMAGEYAVTFDFEETVALQPDYTRQASKRTDAYETVILLEDSGRHIVLQHLLVTNVGGMVIKHWRQDWTYEAQQRLEFTEDQTWRMRPLSAEQTRGAWTQCVYEVSDAPRYCGTGRWAQQDDAPTWTSDRSWRPLPRREYTKRSDYNALAAVNRHTITPSGWTHEQDNSKVLRAGELVTRALVRESGFNDYRRITSFDFSPAYTYWKHTQDYWARVRGQWQQRAQAADGLHLKTSVDGLALIEPLFKQASAAEKGETIDDVALSAVFDQWVDRPANAAASPQRP